MSIVLKFEAATSKDLYAQIVKFIEAGARETGGVAKTETARPVAQTKEEALALVPKDEPPAYKQQAANPDLPSVPVDATPDLEPKTPPAPTPDLEPKTPPAPTPAVLALLKDVGIPAEEWDNIKRTGKGGRMTQTDVNKYASGRVVTLVATEAPAESVAFDAGVANADVETDMHANGTEAPTKTVAEAEEAIRTLFSHENGGRGACFSLLERYSVKRVAEVFPEQLGELVAKAEAIMAGKDTV